MANLVLLDGKYARGFYPARPGTAFPFSQNADYWDTLITREFRQSDATYRPGQLGVDRDPVFTDAYLITESEKRPTGFGDVIATTRVFARVPATQTVEDSTMVNRPSPGLASYPGALGDYRIFQPDTTLVKYDVYSKKTVTGDTGAPSSFYPTGGTYTLTFGANTTGNLNYNDASGTVQTALNAITSVSQRGNVTVSGTYNSAGGFTVSFSYGTHTIDASAITLNMGSATGSVPGVFNNGFTQIAQISGGGNIITGGTFTITIFGQTTAAIAYNASAAAVAAALNLLSEVANRGNCTVTIPSNQTTILSPDPNPTYIKYTINFTSALFSGTATALTPAVASIAVASTISSPSDAPVGAVQSITFMGGSSTRTLFVSGGHGFALTDTLYLRTGSTYYSGIAGTFTLPDASTVQFTILPSAAYASAGTFTEVGKRTKQNYSPGSAPTQVNRVTRFSLSLITPDTYQGADSDFLQAIFSGSTAINYQVGDSTRWPDPKSPIRSLTTTQVSAANL